MNIIAFFILFQASQGSHEYHCRFHSFEFRNEKNMNNKVLLLFWESEIENTMKYYNLEALESKNIHNQMVYMILGEGGATEDQGSPHPPENIPCSFLIQN